MGLVKETLELVQLLQGEVGAAAAGFSGSVALDGLALGDNNQGLRRCRCHGFRSTRFCQGEITDGDNHLGYYADQDFEQD